jgi:hypothetical protein
MPHCKISKSTLDRMQPESSDVIWWDVTLKGFGVKVTPAGRKVFLVQYRPPGGRRAPRKYTLGVYGRLTPHQARVEAQRVLAERAAGRDPQADRQAHRSRMQSERLDLVVQEFLARHAAQEPNSGDRTHPSPRGTQSLARSAGDRRDQARRDPTFGRGARAGLAHHGQSGARGGAQVLQLVCRPRLARAIPVRRGHRPCTRARASPNAGRRGVQERAARLASGRSAACASPANTS